jgi:hypothetical protein
MSNVTIQFEVSGDVDVHEQLCLAIHEGSQGAFRSLQDYVLNIQSVSYKAYRQYANGQEKTLEVGHPDPDDGTLVITDPDDETSWIRLVIE